MYNSPLFWPSVRAKVLLFGSASIASPHTPSSHNSGAWQAILNNFALDVEARKAD
jgi:hypothetical protein